MFNFDLSKLKEEVYPWVENFEFNEEGFFTEQEVDYFINNINKTYDDFTFETGATKCVIVPYHCDYVIKIPFNGIVSTCSNCDMYSSNSTICTAWDCPVREFDMAGGKNSNDYCAYEIEILNKISKEYPLFTNFFLPTIEVLKIDNYPIYVQPKAEMYECNSLKVSEECLNSVKNSSRNVVSAPIDWLGKCLEDLHGNLKDYNDFIKMLKETKVNQDLHSGNIGLYNNHAVIVDYGGFRDY